MNKLYLFGLVFIMMSCGNKNTETTDIQKDKYIKVGDSITAETQKLLLKNVSEQIKQNGLVAAVDFCNVNALMLTNTLADKTMQIERLTNKNRNDNNLITINLDKKAWEELSKNFLEKKSTEPVVLQDNNKVYYYKAIPLGMPTCLQCHGSKQSDISAEVQEVLQIKYPNDKAFDYKLGELRGMWKMTFERQ